MYFPATVVQCAGPGGVADSPLKIFDNREEIAALTDAGVARLCSADAKVQFETRQCNVKKYRLGSVIFLRCAATAGP